MLSLRMSFYKQSLYGCKTIYIQQVAEISVTVRYACPGGGQPVHRVWVAAIPTLLEVSKCEARPRRNGKVAGQKVWSDVVRAV